MRPFTPVAIGSPAATCAALTLDQVFQLAVGQGL
jgi:hypothetical protein